MNRRFSVYIMTNASRTLYVGVTNDLARRVGEHKSKVIRGFTATYNLTRLAYYEDFDTMGDAILREKQIKGWLRARKIALIEATNPTWKDLAAYW